MVISLLFDSVNIFYTLHKLLMYKFAEQKIVN